MRAIASLFGTVILSFGMPACTSEGDDVDHDGDGAVSRIDCDDNDSAVFPGAAEQKDDQIDNDCDGLVDCDDEEATGLYHGDVGEADIDALCDAWCDLTVTGDLTLQDSALVDLDALTCLTAVLGDVIIEDNAALISIAGLSGLREVGGSLVVGDLAVDYETLTVETAGNPALTSLDGLQNVETVGGDLVIGGNDAMVDPGPGLQELVSIGHGHLGSVTLSIGGNAMLTALPAFPKLEELSDLLIVGNPSLGSLAGLEGMRGDEEGAGGEHWITILDNDALADLSGLDGLVDLNGALIVAYNDGLVSLDGLDGLRSITLNLEIWYNMGLGSLKGMGALQSVGGTLQMNGNDALLSLDGLDALSSLGGDFNVMDNDALVSLDGVEGMRTIGGSLQIRELVEEVGNDALAELDGLHGLSSVGADVIVQCSPALTQTELDALVAAIDSIGGAVDANCE